MEASLKIAHTPLSQSTLFGQRLRGRKLNCVKRGIFPKFDIDHESSKRRTKRSLERNAGESAFPNLKVASRYMVRTALSRRY